MQKNQYGSSMPLQPTVDQDVGEVAAKSIGDAATTNFETLQVFIADYWPRPSLDRLIDRCKELQTTQVSKRSVRLEVQQAPDDPRIPWEAMEIRRCIGKLVEQRPEIVPLLDLQSLAIVERCLRIWSISGSALPGSLYIYQALSDVRHKQWNLLAERYGFDPACTDDIIVSVKNCLSSAHPESNSGSHIGMSIQ